MNKIDPFTDFLMEQTFDLGANPSLVLCAKKVGEFYDFKMVHWFKALFLSIFTSLIQRREKVWEALDTTSRSLSADSPDKQTELQTSLQTLALSFPRPKNQRK